jgi:hypothetical protein
VGKVIHNQSSKSDENFQDEAVRGAILLLPMLLLLGVLDMACRETPRFAFALWKQTNRARVVGLDSKESNSLESRDLFSICRFCIIVVRRACIIIAHNTACLIFRRKTATSALQRSFCPLLSVCPFGCPKNGTPY